ncbi:peroxiredoxin-like family protein [Methylobacterium sp. 391_Methyba4]|uniref:peroxiredoxin-like family protein n=1 Tax=Methylobacterium sp. 391_Methyba4 TaxID=3038924 RepID=UPI00241F34F5|nr:peroxiredoxin-like family protein [Methylobacterium sp. 391_Methyba4]WFS09699.1 peroxiredoxin-like family protein [Methylobacterium sp. 391_Methyba4]
MESQVKTPMQRKSLREIRSGQLGSFGRRQLELYEESLQWTKKAEIIDNALKVGDRAPNFILPDAYGQFVSAQELLRRGPLVLSFYRGSWCEFCVSELGALDHALPDFVARAASMAAVSPEVAKYARQLLKQERLSLTLLCDLDYGLSLSFGVLYYVPQSTQIRLIERGIDLPRRHGTQAWMLPVPATYVIDPSGVITAAYINEDYTIRADIELILSHLDQFPKRSV